MLTFRSRYQFSTRPEPDKRKTRGQTETGQDNCSVVEPSRLTESRKRESCGCLASGEFGPARLISPTPPPPHTHSLLLYPTPLVSRGQPTSTSSTSPLASSSFPIPSTSSNSNRSSCHNSKISRASFFTGIKNPSLLSRHGPASTR